MNLEVRLPLARHHTLLTFTTMRIGTLDLTLTSRLSSRAIENLSAELYLGEEATGASCMTSGGQWGGGGAKSLPGDVSWRFDSKKKVRICCCVDEATRMMVTDTCADFRFHFHFLELILGIAMGDTEYAVFVHFPSSRVIYIWVSRRLIPHYLHHSSSSYSAKNPRPARALRIRFEIHQHSFSALKVDQLRLTGEGYKPYKGVRGRCVGDVEWRW